MALAFLPAEHIPAVFQSIQASELASTGWLGLKYGYSVSHVFEYAWLFNKNTQPVNLWYNTNIMVFQ